MEKNANISLRSRAFKGAGFLAFRQIAVNIVNFTGNLILARILIPADFGIYALVQFLITLFTLIGDSGLGAIIIKKRHEPSRALLTTVFSFQMTMMGVISILLFAATWVIAPHLKSGVNIWLFRVSIISFFLLAFRSVPVVLLDRELEYGKVAMLEITENLAFQATAVTMAFMKFGVWSLICGLLAKNIAMFIVLQIISTFKIGFGIKPRFLRHIIPYGIMFQGSNFVNFIKDSTVPVWIGATIGMSSLGYISWANSIASYPLLLSNMFSRMIFPIFSRVQHEKEKLKEAIEIVLRINIGMVMCLATVLFSCAEPIIKIVYTDKWMPALTLFSFLTIACFFQAGSSTVVSAYNASGRSGYTFRISLVWVLFTWLFSLILVPRFGINGYGAAIVLTYVLNIFFLYGLKKDFNVSVFRNILPPLAAFLITAAAAKVPAFSFNARVNSLVKLAAFAAAAGTLYTGMLLAFSRGRYIKDVKFILQGRTK